MHTLSLSIYIYIYPYIVRWKISLASWCFMPTFNISKHKRWEVETCSCLRPHLIFDQTNRSNKSELNWLEQQQSHSPGQMGWTSMAPGFAASNTVATFSKYDVVIASFKNAFGSPDVTNQPQFLLDFLVVHVEMRMSMTRTCRHQAKLFTQMSGWFDTKHMYMYIYI